MRRRFVQFHRYLIAMEQTKLTKVDAIALLDTLVGVQQAVRPCGLSVRAALGIAKLRPLCTPIIEARNALVEEQSERDGDDKPIMLAPNVVKLKNPEEFKEREKEIMEGDLDVELPRFTEEYLITQFEKHQRADAAPVNLELIMAHLLVRESRK